MRDGGPGSSPGASMPCVSCDAVCWDAVELVPGTDIPMLRQRSGLRGESEEFDCASATSQVAKWLLHARGANTLLRMRTGPSSNVNYV